MIRQSMFSPHATQLSCPCTNDNDIRTNWHHHIVVSVANWKQSQALDEVHCCQKPRHGRLVQKQNAVVTAGAVQFDMHAAGSPAVCNVSTLVLCSQHLLCREHAYPAPLHLPLAAPSWWSRTHSSQHTLQAPADHQKLHFAL